MRLHGHEQMHDLCRPPAALFARPGRSLLPLSTAGYHWPSPPLLATHPERMRLSEFLRSDFVLKHLEARDVDGVVRELSARAGSVGVAPEDVVANKLLERERTHSTVMGSGLAIPHATVPGLEDPVIGIALARPPIVFGPTDADPVRVFVVLLSPPGHEREHVKILARICRLMRHEDFIDRLEAAEDDEGVIEVIESIDAQHA